METSTKKILIYDRNLIEEKKYWLEKLYCEMEYSNINIDYRRSSNMGELGRTSVKLDKSLVERLNKVSGNSDFLLYTLLMTTLNICIHKYTGNNAIVIGSPARSNDGDCNALSIISNIDSNASARDLLMQVRSTLLEAYSKQRYPFRRLISDFGLQNVADKCPLFDIVLSLNTIHGPLPELNNDVTLAFNKASEKNINVVLSYRKDLFAESSISRFINHFCNLLTLFLIDSTRKISKLEMITQQERDELLIKNAPTPYPQQSLTELFEQKTQDVPNNIAITLDTQTSTYAQLNSHSNQLAHHLQQLGIETGDRVALALDRSVNMITSILAVLKTGAAYIPFDRGYPKESINNILTETAAKVIITQQSFADLLPETELISICLDNDWQAISELPDNNLASVYASSDAYVLYTSGTTGKPKLIAMPHSNVVNLVYGIKQRVYDNYPNETLNISLISSFVFDASIPQIFAPLLLGHTLHIAPNEARYSGSELIRFYQQHHIDISDGTPFVLQALIKASEDKTLDISVRNFMIGGEALPQPLLHHFFSLFDDTNPVVTNLYGPAECCGESTTFEINRDNVDNFDNTPIGKPLANEQVYILNKQLHLQPAGTIGELCISGNGVAKGYLNQPELSAEHFVDNPFEPGSLLYRTGDLVRLLPDGNLQYHGRQDTQVKIRGQRVELTTVENSLLKFTKEVKSKIRAGEMIGAIQSVEIQVRCKRCTISLGHPGVSFNSEGVCSVCEHYDENKSHADRYFQTTQDLTTLMDMAQNESNAEYDCMLLFSGGKDSTYVLQKLVDMGLKVLAYTFDNGFISKDAFNNIERITKKLSVDSIVTQAGNMNEIFVESLNADHTVCSGCFKALTTASTKIAAEKGINAIFTGLSRGQIFETKLQGIFEEGVFDPDAIEEKLLLFRKMYHGNQDRIARLLDTDLTEVNFDRIYWLDYFRFDNTSSAKIFEYLKSKDDYWTRPTETGFCSTNCNINDIGICVHARDRGFHNYEAPLGWDVRLGLTERDEALGELNYNLNTSKVNRVLNKIGYFTKRIKDVVVQARKDKDSNDVLCAYYCSNQNISNTELREYLLEYLPQYMIPTHFLKIREIPRTQNGKVDYRALPAPEQTAGSSNKGHVAPKSQLQRQLASIWRNVLSLEKISIHDNFFDLGGHSLLMTKVHSQLIDSVEQHLSIIDLFTYPTIATLCEYIDGNENKTGAETEQVSQQVEQRASLQKQARQRKKAKQVN